LNLSEKNVLVIGGGVAGISAAVALARLGVAITIVEKRAAIGGHGRLFTCKATQTCVKCGACAVEAALQQASAAGAVRVLTGSRVTECSASPPFRVSVTDEKAGAHTLQADAVIVATGFAVFNPEKKPYGYGRFPNVITSLELESLLRREGRAKRPSDGQPPRRVAFIQCVGSRDATLGHLWCSRICCGSALRMARLIQHRRPETEVSVFYIDIQSFGRDFESVYAQARQSMRFVRAIPADIYPLEGDGLQLTYFDGAEGVSREEPFDLVVLSVGLLPGDETSAIGRSLNLERDDDGFLRTPLPAAGLFVAGAAGGPMTIAESIASAGRAAWQAATYLSAREATP
jgi:heterodisulfide reductase subunit A